MAFSGFPDSQKKFFSQLAKNQNRDWFRANKDRYEKEWAAPMLECLTDISARIDDAYPECELEAPKVFRIYRDVRFGKDKSPFKTSISGIISIKASAAVMDKPAALYLQIGQETFAAGGFYMMAPERLAKMRSAIVDTKRGKEIAKIVSSLKRRGFTFEVGEKLKRAPRGFSEDHPLVDLLKMKGMVTRFPPLGDIGKPAFSRALVRDCKAVAELVTWVTYASV